jgi:hypothetical protein
MQIPLSEAAMPEPEPRPMADMESAALPERDPFPVPTAPASSTLPPKPVSKSAARPASDPLAALRAMSDEERIALFS